MIEVDIKNWIAIDVLSIRSCADAFDVFGDVDGLLIAPPCTDLSVSGAQYWSIKDRDGRTALSAELVHQALRLVDLYRPTDEEYDGPFFWALENPVGRLNRVVPQLRQHGPWYFDPCDYAGYLDPDAETLERLSQIREKAGVDVTREENDLVVRWNAYTKKTGLWGEFNRPDPRRVEPVKTCVQGGFTQRLGGKGELTKELRSNTPEGFAIAFYQSNVGKTYEGGKP